MRIIVGLENSDLGKKVRYDGEYNPDRLCIFDRATKRDELGMSKESLTFYGVDSWNHYEVSCLNTKGKPLVATAQIRYDCNSPRIVESKSLKLYFNTFNNIKFSNLIELQGLIKHDLEQALCTEVFVSLQPLSDCRLSDVRCGFIGLCLDTLDIHCQNYTVDPGLLFTHAQLVEEKLYSDLLRSNCLITHQPDWGSIFIDYKGHKIDHSGLLKYIVSFRNHNEFHEQCIERIYVDIMNYCKPEKLTVYGRYTRRGGLDINPLRSSHPFHHDLFDIRLVRQ